MIINHAASALPAPPDAPAAKLYQRIQGGDPERMGGTQVRYNSFADFMTTFDQEARDPKVVGAADVLDMINPLQHLPLIGQLYREVTDDQIKPVARIMGGAVFGGPVGMAGSSVNAVVQEETGQDVAENVMTALVPGARPVPPKPALPDTPENALSTLLAESSGTPPATTQHTMRSAYIHVAEMKPADKTERVMMRDPERMAGSMVRYA